MGHFGRPTTAPRRDILRKQRCGNLVYVPNYQNTIGQRILKKCFFCHFFRQVEFFFKNKFRKNPNLADPSCAYEGGSPPGRVENTVGWKIRAKTPATPSESFFRKIFFSKKFARPCPPPGPLHGTPHGPPIFFNFVFQFWTTGAPFYIFFF